MKEISYNLWNKIKNQADIWLFFAFILTFTLSVRKVLYYYPVQKAFNEYTGIYLYASDIFFILGFIIFIVFILENNTKLLSIYKNSLLASLGNLYISIPGILVIISFSSIVWSQNQDISIYRSIKLFEAYILYLYLSLRFVPHALFHTCPPQVKRLIAVEQLKKDNSKNVPRGTFSATKEPLNYHFSSEKIKLNKLWLIYGLLSIQILVLILAFHKSILLGSLAALLCAIILYIYLNKNSLPLIVPRGTIKEFLGWGMNKKYGISSSSSEINRIWRSKILKVSRNCSTWNNFLLLIISLGTFQSFIAIWQVILQRSLGFFWLKESTISQNIPGVAKIILHNHNYIRAYGLFPHPNILGGFLLLSIVITFLYKKLIVSTSSKIVPRGTISATKVSLDYHFSSEKIKLNKSWLIYGLLSIQIFALFLAFSKSAILGLLIALAYIKIKTNCSTWNILEKHHPTTSCSNVQRIVPCLPINNSTKTIWNILQKRSFLDIAKKMFHVEHFRKIILILGILTALLAIAKPNINTILFQSLKERLYYLDISNKVISNNSFLGLGNGQFVLNIPSYSKGIVESWQFQPVHNVFLLIWSELGIIGLGLFIWLLWILFYISPTRTEGLSTLEQSKNDNQEIVPRGTISATKMPLDYHFSSEKIKLNKLWLIYGLLSIQIFALVFAFSKSALVGLVMIILYIVIESQCSTWNIVLKHIKKILTSEKYLTIACSSSNEAGSISMNNTTASQTNSHVLRDNTILCNDMCLLSIRATQLHFQGILLGFIFIMLFDHYFWDIWPGQVMFWLVAGIIAGIEISLEKE